ncbi:MAG: PhzF family phenazine biosynthesis protein [Rhodospirillales bacterium]|nr:PhzF family phenazine biosynthesis protein [Rhodospirillales bacterium]
MELNLYRVDLCGHATLGAAWVLFNRLGRSSDSVTFHTRSGPLKGDRVSIAGNVAPYLEGTVTV